MKSTKAILLLVLAAAATLQLAAQGNAPAAQEQENTAGTRPCPANPGPGLEAALTTMDRAAGSFHSAQTDFNWTTYTAVVQESDKQGGVMYIQKKADGSLQMAADITIPPSEAKFVLYEGDKDLVQLFQPKINQVTQYKTGKHREAFESFLVLGFGGRGHDLNQRFAVHYCGMENVDGTNAYRLDLTPKAADVRRTFDRIVLWIDPSSGVSVQQKFFEPETGNYRLAVYRDIKLNRPVPASAFSLKTNSKTTYVSAGM